MRGMRAANDATATRSALRCRLSPRAFDFSRPHRAPQRRSTVSRAACLFVPRALFIGRASSRARRKPLLCLAEKRATAAGTHPARARRRHAGHARPAGRHSARAPVCTRLAGAVAVRALFCAGLGAAGRRLRSAAQRRRRRRRRRRSLRRTALARAISTRASAGAAAIDAGWCVLLARLHARARTHTHTRARTRTRHPVARSLPPRRAAAAPALAPAPGLWRALSSRGV